MDCIQSHLEVWQSCSKFRTVCWSWHTLINDFAQWLTLHSDKLCFLTKKYHNNKITVVFAKIMRLFRILSPNEPKRCFNYKFLARFWRKSKILHFSFSICHTENFRWKIYWNSIAITFFLDDLVKKIV